MNPIWQALAREAALAAEHIAIGVTALGRANYAQTAYYGQAFFGLTIGLERACKLVFVVNHAIDHDGRFPLNEALLKLGHQLDKLLDLADQIANQRGLLDPKERLPRSPIHEGIIETLADFANNATRYYNLDLVTGDVQAQARGDPVKQWFDHVTTPILDRHYKAQYKKRHEGNARLIADRISGFTLVRHMAETGKPLDNVFDASRATGANTFAKPYERMYVLQICRFAANVLEHLGYLAQQNQIENIPYLSEFFAIFINKRRRNI